MNPITISVLFTDIEGSTERWERYPEEMRRALERHDAILRACFSGSEIRFIKHTGDGMVWASTDPTMLVLAAIDAQTQLDAIDWQEVEGLRVRMGAHIGELHERDGDLFGTPINLAARVMAGASGGQIAITADLLDQVALPSPWTADELGRFRFRGILEPVVVHGLAHPARPPHPPYRSGAPELGNLPATRVELIGRADVLDELNRAIRSPGVVTVVGPGGVGKTSLVLAAGRTAEHVFPDGRWFVDLTTVHSDHDVVPHVVATLGLVTDNDETPTAVLGRALTSRSMLVVLDNCEHVIGGVRDALRQSLWADHRATIVSTSREVVRHRAEHLIAVAPLDTSRVDSDAVALFIERAATANPDVSWSDNGRSEVRTLCAHLDGLPLAIELAASRAATFSVSRILGLLDSRFRLLKGTGEGRHDTLEATIAWSYELLTDAERDVLCASALLDGNFDLEQVVAAADVDIFDGADLITSLLNKSLINRSTDTTATDTTATDSSYRLFESIRAFALTRLDEGAGRDAIADRLARYALDLIDAAAAGINGPEQVGWFDRIDRSMPAIRVAIDRLLVTAAPDALMLLVRMYPYWIARGNRHDALRALLDALARAPEGDGSQHTRAWADASTFAFYCGEGAALEYGMRSIEVAERTGLPARPSALVRLAALHLLDNGTANALAALDQAIAHLDHSFEPPEPPEVPAAVGALVAMAGQGQRGIEVCRAAMAGHPTPSPSTEVSDLLNLALALRGDDPEAAVDVFAAARDLADGTRSPFYAVTAGVAGGLCLRRLGRDDEALAMFVRALPVAHQLGMQSDTVTAIRSIARLLQARSNPDGESLLIEIDAVRRSLHERVPIDLGSLVEDALDAARNV